MSTNGLSHVLHCAHGFGQRNYNKKNLEWACRLCSVGHSAQQQKSRDDGMLRRRRQHQQQQQHSSIS